MSKMVWNSQGFFEYLDEDEVDEVSHKDVVEYNEYREDPEITLNRKKEIEARRADKLNKPIHKTEKNVSDEKDSPVSFIISFVILIVLVIVLYCYASIK